MKKFRKIIIIGAGISAIFLTIKLLLKGYSGKNIVLIEEGNDIYTRKSDEIMNGFGGAGGFSDGKIIYSLTRGGDLVSYTGKEKAKELIKEIKNIIRYFHPQSELIKTSKSKSIPKFIQNSNFAFLQTDLDHIGTDYLIEMNKNIFEFFKSSNVEMYFNNQVLDIEFENRLINVLNLKNNNVTKIFYDDLIVAVGKSGINFIQNLITKYNLKTTPRASQIGVRFESLNKYFSEVLKIQYDFKLAKNYKNNISARTFCVNSNTAYITIEKTYGLKTFNGHAYINEKMKNGLINFGIMLEVPNIKDPYQFTYDLVSKCNISDLGRYYSPTRLPTVEAQKTDLKTFIKLYEDYGKIVINFIKDLKTLFNFRDDYIIYFPECKYLTNKIVVNENDFSLKNYPSIHFMGDCLSARGIFVSSAQGLYLAESFVN